MERDKSIDCLSNTLKNLKQPVLVVSTVVGRGMRNLGEALCELFPAGAVVRHLAVENLLPPAAVTEDLKRYKFISDRLRFLLYFIYKFPIFYYRKYFREKTFAGSDLTRLKKAVDEFSPKTIICVSHRPAFWVSALKTKEKMRFTLWGISGEYGKNLGWRYIFWEAMDGFLAPVNKNMLGIAFHERLKVSEIDLPARKQYYNISNTRGDANSVLLVCGFWGQGPILKITRLLLKNVPQLKIRVVCGENLALYKKTAAAFTGNVNVSVVGIAESLAPFLKECASIITKPGISTILEARAAGRKIFLLKGMPVAEDNNAGYAIKNLGAEWFNMKKFSRWHRLIKNHREVNSQSASGGISPKENNPAGF